MKKLMIGASAKLAELLSLRESNPAEYRKRIDYFLKTYCGNWEK